jgi:hypothetical protein
LCQSPEFSHLWYDARWRCPSTGRTIVRDVFLSMASPRATFSFNSNVTPRPPPLPLLTTFYWRGCHRSSSPSSPQIVVQRQTPALRQSESPPPPKSDVPIARVAPSHEGHALDFLMFEATSLQKNSKSTRAKTLVNKA